jgi:arabinose-5-phosphate isomerase
VSLDAGVERECDPNDLAPTASTTVSLVLGDALAVALLVARGFTAGDFKERHPGGALGKR